MLEAELRRARRGEARCVMLVADPGLGKTRLANELLQRNQRWTITLSARAYPLGDTTPYGVWAEALERHLRPLDTEAVRSLCGAFATDLAPVLGSAGLAAAAEPGRPSSRIRLLKGLALLLGNLAAQRPLAAFLDDVQLADTSSWYALNFVVRNLRDTPWLLVLAARPAELAANTLATDIVLALEQEGLLQRLPVTPLNRTSLGQLAGLVLNTDSVPEPLLVWLEERSRGYPLFALGLLRALAEAGGDLSAPSLDRVPDELSERVMARVKALDEPALAALEMLAVVGRQLELSELAALTERPVDRLSAILGRLLRGRFIAEHRRAAEIAYEITHPLVQEAIYEGIGGARRRALHRLAARALKSSGKLGAAAPHFARSAPPGDPEAVQALIETLAQTERQESHGEAIAILKALLDLLPEGDPRWIEVLDAMRREAGWVIEHRSDLDALIALEAMRRIEKVVEHTADLGRRAAVQHRLASFLNWGTGDVGAARVAAGKARDLFKRAGQESLARIAAYELTWSAGLSGDVEGQIAGARALADEAERAGDRFALREALGSLACGCLYAGHFAEAEDACTRMLSIARADGAAYRVVWCLALLGQAYAMQGRIHDAFTSLEEATRDATLYEDSIGPAMRAQACWYRGAFAEAVTVARQITARHPGGLSRRLGWGLVYAALSSVELGALDVAHRQVRQAEQAFADRLWLPESVTALWGRALLAARTGDLKGAIARLGPAAQQELDGGNLAWAGPILLDLAETAARAGEPAVARQAASDLDRVATEIDRDLQFGLARIADSQACLAAGTNGRGVASARLAVRLLAPGGCRAFHGRALQVLGQTLAGSDRAAATAHLSLAAAEFQACGAQWRLQQTLTELAVLGGAGRQVRSAALGPASLTRREREIIKLTVEGRTAKEIAQVLGIGVRTVEWHLENAKAKLGVDSKLQLVGKAYELGI